MPCFWTFTVDVLGLDSYLSIRIRIRLWLYKTGSTNIRIRITDFNFLQPIWPVYPFKSIHFNPLRIYTYIYFKLYINGKIISFYFILIAGLQNVCPGLWIPHLGQCLPSSQAGYQDQGDAPERRQHEEGGRSERPHQEDDIPADQDPLRWTERLWTPVILQQPLINCPRVYSMCVRAREGRAYWICNDNRKLATWFKRRLCVRALRPRPKLVMVIWHLHNVHMLRHVHTDSNYRYMYTHRTHPELGTRQHCHDSVTMLSGQKLLLISLWLLQVGTEALTFFRNFSVTEALTCFRVVVFAKKEKKLSCAKLCRTGYGRNVYKLTWKEETIDAYS